MQRACDWLVDRHTKGPTDSEVRCALRLGAYQLGWTRIPSHAAVSETVGEVTGPGRSLVNAVLRRVSADIERGLVVWPDVATELSYPDWIVDVLRRELGVEVATAALKTMNQAASPTLRDDGYIQDLASQMVGTHLGTLLGDAIHRCRILDVSAAPGGKATALASMSAPESVTVAAGEAIPLRSGPSLIVAADLSPARTTLMASNIRRLDASHVKAVVADGCTPCFKPASFDAVLVDAPCSGLGVLRRRPDARWRVRREDLETLARLQRRLVTSALELVRPGGILAYSVCTMTAVETAGIDNWIARRSPDLRPLPPPPNPWTPAGRGGLLSSPRPRGPTGCTCCACGCPPSEPDGLGAAGHGQVVACLSKASGSCTLTTQNSSPAGSRITHHVCTWATLVAPSASRRTTSASTSSVSTSRCTRAEAPTRWTMIRKPGVTSPRSA